MASYTSGSPGAGQLEIGIALVLQDRFSNQAREASGVIKKLHNDAKMAVNANAIALQGIANGVSSFAMGMAGTLSDIVIEGAEFVGSEPGRERSRPPARRLRKRPWWWPAAPF